MKCGGVWDIIIMGLCFCAALWRDKNISKTVAFFRDDPYKQVREQRPAKTAMNRLAAHEERKQDLEGETTVKNKAELNALKEEAETESKKPHGLNDEELVQVSGGAKAVRDDTQGERKVQAILQETVPACIPK